MKKILQLLVLGIGVIAQAQTPIRHFTFSNSLTDDTGNVSFAPLVSGASYSYSADEAGNLNSAVSLTLTPLIASIPDLPQGNSPRTIMIKVRSICYGGENPVFSYGTGSGAIVNKALGISHIDNSSSPGFTYLDNKLRTYSYGTGYDWYYQGAGIVAGDYNLITLAYDGTTLKTYLGSTVVTSQTVSLNTTGTNFHLNSVLGDPSTIGGNQIIVDDLKIYDVALTQQQILQNYLDPGTNFNTGLLAFYDFQNNLNSSTGTHNLTAYNGNNPNFYLGVEGTPSSKSAWFEGTTAAYNTSLAAAFNNSEYTIAYWEKGVNTTAYNSYGTTYEFFGSHYSRRNNIGIYKTGLYADPLNNWMSEITGDFLTTWIHKAYVFKYNSVSNTTTITQYQNGLVVNFESLTGQQMLHQFNNKFTIGSGTDSAGNFLASKFGKVGLDKFFIYSRALTKKEINIIKVMHEEVFNISTLAIADFNNKDIRVQLYPNPVNDILNIETDLDIQSAEIYNIQGQKVLTSNQKQCNVSGLTSGVYMVRIQDAEDKIATKKIVIK